MAHDYKKAFEEVEAWVREQIKEANELATTHNPERITLLEEMWEVICNAEEAAEVVAS